MQRNSAGPVGLFESTGGIPSGARLHRAAASTKSMHVICVWGALKGHRRIFTAPLKVAHLSAGVPLDGLLDFAVRASPQRLQQLVAVFQIVLVVVFLHA